jgi:hypothetical protein
LAVDELRRAWASFTDEEVAELFSPYADWTSVSHPNPQERELEKRARAAMPEELISRAIGRTERIDSEEVDRRIRILNQQLGIFERGNNIRRLMLASGEGGAR